MARFYKSKTEHERQFRLLYERNYAPITAYVRRRVRRDDGSDADIVAEVFVVAWRRFLEVPEQTKELPWLYGVARNLVANYFRSVQRSSALTDRLKFEEKASFDDATGTSDVEMRVRHAVDQLSDLDREIFRLIHWEELSHEEVGLSVGITTKAVERRVARARKKVRDYLDSLDKFITPSLTKERSANTTIYPIERTIAS
ncbi:MAG: sigma-70 family RNA polymerase sigma factor [Acidimicrobiales bacterium]